MNPMCVTPQTAQERAQQALTERRFFKLIAGGSLTHPDVVAALVRIYGDLPDVSCLDIAPDWPVVARVVAVLEALPDPPLLMLSLDVDGDPHFRKATLDAQTCTTCGDCVPVCPTQAFTLSHQGLTLSDPLCYGCGRCLPVCPVAALDAKPTSVLPELLAQSLMHPRVGAVELHVNALSEATLAPFLDRMTPYLSQKLISLCFRPQGESSIEAEVTALKGWLQWCAAQNCFAMLQIDGAPMSGSSDPAASLPALANARFYHAHHARRLHDFGLSPLPVTISGGINAATGVYLRESHHDFVAGVGVGTVAREAVWPWLEDLERAREKAKRLVTQILPL